MKTDKNIRAVMTKDIPLERLKKICDAERRYRLFILPFLGSTKYTFYNGAILKLEKIQYKIKMSSHPNATMSDSISVIMSGENKDTGYIITTGYPANIGELDGIILYDTQQEAEKEMKGETE